MAPNLRSPVVGFLTAFAVFLAVVPRAHAQIPGPNGVIYACVRLDRDRDEGKLARLVAADEQCKRNEVRVQWNVAGPKGATGNTGAQGPAGVAGPKGDKGSTGNTGAKGDPGTNGAPGQPGQPGADGAIGPTGPAGAPAAAGAIAGQLVSCAPNTDFTGSLVVIPGHSFTAYTGSDGAFLIHNVPAGTYNIAIQHGSDSASVTQVVVQDALVTLAPIQIGTCGPPVCTPGASSACYSGPAGTNGVGACSAGVQTCNASGTGYGACVGQTTPVAEVCGDGIDNDCDGQVDEDCVCVPTLFYADVDQDGYGAGGSTLACTAPPGYVTDNTDCNDTDPNIHPGAAEVCDAFGRDENCNGLVNEAGALGMQTFYVDNDQDGYGSGVGIVACIAPPGYVANHTDCNDGDPGISPGQPEVCDANRTDENCNGLANEPGALGMQTFYRDADGDGYGTAMSSITSCAPPSGYTFNALDCNDSDSSVNPDAVEVCDGKDNNCDALIDNAPGCMVVSLNILPICVAPKKG